MPGNPTRTEFKNQAPEPPVREIGQQTHRSWYKIFGEYPMTRHPFWNLFCGAILTLVAVSGSRGAIAAIAALSPRNPSALMPAIMQAYHADWGEVVIPPGVYKLPEPRGGFYLSFDHMKSFRIIGKGVTLLRTDPTKGGIEFHRCRNVTLDGVTLRCDPIPYTQGRIIAMSRKKHFLDVRINSGYRTDIPDPLMVATVFNPQRFQITAGSCDIFSHHITSIGRRTFRIFTMSPLTSIRIGDLLELRGHGPPDVANIECRRMTIEHVTIMAGTGFCFYEQGGGGNRYIDDSIVYPPKPHGATLPPLRASNADGLHSNFARHGPIVVGCHFEGMGDDGIAIHGWYAMLRRSAGRRWIVLFPYGTPYGNTKFFRAGDRLKLYDPGGGYLGQTRLVNIKRLASYKPKRSTSLPDIKQGAFDGPHLNFYEVTVRHQIAKSGFEDRICDTNAIGSGFIVRHCVILQNRGRGMLIKADNGIIEDNTVDGSSVGGIEITPEFWWDEAGCSSHLLIEGNTIEHVGYASTDVPGWYQAGALSICANTHTQAVGFGHADIVVTDNRFVNNDGMNILLTDAKNVLLAGNVFLGAMRQPNDRGAAFHFDTSSLIWLQQCKNILFADNRVIRPGPAMKTMVGVGPDVSHVMGITQQHVAGTFGKLTQGPHRLQNR